MITDCKKVQIFRINKYCEELTNLTSFKLKKKIVVSSHVKQRKRKITKEQNGEERGPPIPCVFKLVGIIPRVNF